MTARPADERRRRAHELRARDLSVRAIAKELGCSPALVQKYLADPPPIVGCTPPYTPSDQGVSDQSRIFPISPLETWGSSEDPTYEALAQLRPYARGCTPHAGLDHLWSPLDSRWDETDRCFCSFHILRYSLSRQRLSWKLMTPEENEGVRPLIRCPQHNGQVRRQWCHLVRHRAHNPTEVFRYLFTDTRHAASAIDHARRKEIPYIKARYQFTWKQPWWLTVSSEPLCTRSRTKARAYEQTSSASHAGDMLDWALQVIDPLVRVTGAFDWAIEYERIEPREPDPDIQTITIAGHKNPIREVSRVLGRDWHGTGPFPLEDWLKVQAAQS